MAARRYVSIVDIVVAVVALVAIFLPARGLEGVSAASTPDGADLRFATGAAEARVHARPDDGAAAAELSRKLVEAGETDFAVEAPADAAARMRGQPSRWRAQLATARAWGELREAKDALQWAHDAKDSCTEHADACPEGDAIRIGLYVDYLEAGLEQGIDPKADPEGFRHAGEKGLHIVHLAPNPLTNPPSPSPAPAPPSSGSGAPAPAPTP
jgi:hypothetical protein